MESTGPSKARNAGFPVIDEANAARCARSGYSAAIAENVDAVTPLMLSTQISSGIRSAAGSAGSAHSGRRRQADRCCRLAPLGGSVLCCRCLHSLPICPTRKRRTASIWRRVKANPVCRRARCSRAGPAPCERQGLAWNQLGWIGQLRSDGPAGAISFADSRGGAEDVSHVRDGGDATGEDEFFVDDQGGG